MVQIAAGTGSRRLGLVVGRRVGTAVVRNRVKRYVRGWFREHRELLPEGADLVVVARGGAARHTSASASRELSALVTQRAR